MRKIYIILLSRDLKNKKVRQHPPSSILPKKKNGDVPRPLGDLSDKVYSGD